MPDIEIKRGYEVLPDNNVRFGIRVTNNSDFAISEVEVLLDYSDSLFELSGNKVHKLGTIPPALPRTAKFILKPLSCIHKENIGATIIYKDHQWKKHTIEMHPKEVHCVCPFLKEKSIKRSEFLTLSKSGFFEERGVNFDGITVEKLVEFISHTCKNRLYKVEEFPIENGRILYLAGDAVGEKAYYLLTAVVKKYEGLAQVLLRANSDKNYGLNGFLNEILDNMRHLVVSASAREIGIIRKEQVINIIDSVVQRSSFSVSDGAPSVNVQDSVVQRAEIKADEERKKHEEERLRKEREEQERLGKQKGKEDEERRRREEEQKREKKEKYEAFLLKQKKDEEERKVREERERKAEAERREREKQNAIQEEDRQSDEAARMQPENKSERVRIEHEEKSSGGKWFFVVIIILGVLALGWYGTQGSSSSVISTTQNSIPSKTTPITTAKAAPTVASVVISSADQKTITNSIGMDFVLIPAGEFNMGSPSNEAGRYGTEGPVHHVKISNAFYMGKYEVTQKQWRDVMGNSPSYFKGDNLPVEQVSWSDAQDFIKKLNEKESGKKYQLPTEAEWEYSARAGTTTRYSFGDDDSKLGDYAWYGSLPGGKTHDVGQKKPNPWGLYDMYGNVWEWVQDNWHVDYDGAPPDGSSWESGDGSARIFRGCSWNIIAESCRSAFRYVGNPGLAGSDDPGFHDYAHGFRLLRDL